MGKPLLELLLPVVDGRSLGARCIACSVTRAIIGKHFRRSQAYNCPPNQETQKARSATSDRHRARTRSLVRSLACLLSSSRRHWTSSDFSRRGRHSDVSLDSSSAMTAFVAASTRPLFRVCLRLCAPASVCYVSPPGKERKKGKPTH